MNFSNKDFVHFHCHSMYSRFDGLCNLSKLVMTAREMGFPALALTDHGNIMGLISFLLECRMKEDKKGNKISYPPIKPILGLEAYIARKMDIGQYSEKKSKSKDTKKNQPDGRKGNRHLTLYAMNYKGYQNLCTLSQRSWMEGFYSDPRIDIDLLNDHSEGLMGGSACLSNIINANLMHGNYEQAKKAAATLKDIFRGNFFLEVMYQGIREQKLIIPSIFKIGKELDIPVLATQDVHYIKKNQSLSQEVLMCMSTNRCIKDPKRIHHDYDEFYLKSAQEMAQVFGEYPDCLHNTTMMAERIDTDDIEKNLFGGMRLPKFEIPEKYNDPYDYLCDLAWEGLERVGWGSSEKHIEALKMELEDVKVARDSNDYDFSTYFLIVQDYIKVAKEKGALVACGRGSGYASVLLRCLDITYGADPIKYELIWERFLGFDTKKFIMEKDFGFNNETINISKTDLDEDRELEDDLGGIDRY